VSNILEFPDKKEQQLLIAILQGIDADLERLSHPAVSEPEIDVRRQALNSAIQLALATNYKGQFGEWREKHERQLMLMGIGTSVFFVALWLVLWWIDGKWWSGIGNLAYAGLAWFYNWTMTQWMDGREVLDSIRLKIEPLQLPRSH